MGGGVGALSCVWVGALVGAPRFGPGACEHAVVSALPVCVGWLNSLAFGDVMGWDGDGDGDGMGWDGDGVGACFSVRRAPGFALELVVQSGLGVTCLCSSCALVGGCVQMHCMCQGSWLRR